MVTIENTSDRARWDKELYPEFRENSLGQRVRTHFDQASLRPTNDLFTCFYHEPKLRRFFYDLAQHGIHNLEDLAAHTSEELFEIAPMNSNGQRLFSAYVAEGFISVKAATLG